MVCIQKPIFLGLCKGGDPHHRGGGSYNRGGVNLLWHFPPYFPSHELNALVLQTVLFLQLEISVWDLRGAQWHQHGVYDSAFGSYHLFRKDARFFLALSPLIIMKALGPLKSDYDPFFGFKPNFF